jgi:hypothetical protein
MNSLGEVVMNQNLISIGRNTLPLDVSKFSQGNYFYQLKAGNKAITKKFTVIR